MGVWDKEADWNHDVLARIVALLFALANLADLAAGCPARRREALGFLIFGEAEARAFVVGMAPEHWTERREAVSGKIRCSNKETARRHDSDEVTAALDAPVEADEPAFFDDAAGLAARFRVLGFVLWFLAAQAGRPARPGANPPRPKPVGRSVPARLSAARNRQSAPPAPDTS